MSRELTKDQNDWYSILTRLIQIGEMIEELIVILNGMIESESGSNGCPQGSFRGVD